MTDLKPYIRGQVTFQYYRDSALWYETENGFLFPVPLSDCGTTTFPARDKGIFFMRWIRKYLQSMRDAA